MASEFIFDLDWLLLRPLSTIYPPIIAKFFACGVADLIII
jgi:hypothetical protein